MLGTSAWMVKVSARGAELGMKDEKEKIAPKHVPPESCCLGLSPRPSTCHVVCLGQPM